MKPITISDPPFPQTIEEKLEVLRLKINEIIEEMNKGEKNV
jgi:hypothetical protein